MEKVFFGLGSNLGDRARYLQQAREALADLPLQEFQASSIYESLPLAIMDQP
ncbi:MAG: 2-amino-4-hydroxy-6-hydroxymethyldihydropteridine diphosphokinase, partial [bacterium]